MCFFFRPQRMVHACMHAYTRIHTYIYQITFDKLTFICCKPRTIATVGRASNSQTFNQCLLVRNICTSRQKFAFPSARFHRDSLAFSFHCHQPFHNIRSSVYFLSEMLLEREGERVSGERPSERMKSKESMSNAFANCALLLRIHSVSIVFQHPLMSFPIYSIQVALQFDDL